MGILAGGVNLYFIYKFLRILTTKWEDTDAFKLGIIDEKGKILKKHSTLKSSDEKDAYTLMHRLVWKLKRLLNKIPGGKSKLASYAAALWLIKEEREFTGTNEELQESFLTFLESDWKNDALILKETYEGDMNKTTYTTLMSNMSEAGDKEAYQAFFKATLKKFGVTEPDQLEGDKKKKFFDAIDKGWKGDNEKPEPGDKKEEVEIDEAVLVNRDYKYDGKIIKISKKNFSKVSKDFKNDTPGKERMITYDSKWGTVSVPVKFTEEVKMDESEIATSIGSGGTAGLDIGLTYKKKKEDVKKAKALRKQMVGEEVQRTTFAGKDVFIVDSETYYNCRLGKKKYGRYEKYVGDGEVGQTIREYGLKYPRRPIILQNGDGGPMLYLKYGRS